VVFDISVEGNRPDAWSIIGVARDLATRLGRELRAPSIASPHGTVASADVATARIDAPELCGRLTVSVLRHVTVAPSPAWVQHRIRAAGMRPISNVVDASNLVMLELGQPTHPYDAEHVAGRTIGVRRARAGETLVTLDGVTRSLATAGRGLGDTGVDCVIVDGDDRVLGLAGIMGGATSEISAATCEVLLEAAFFDPMAIARSSKRHGLRSEASNRFERGVDPELALRAAGRFVSVLAESVPELEWLVDPLDVRGHVPAVPTIEIRRGDIERALGQAIDDDDVSSILRGLGFVVHDVDGAFSVTAPSARLDVRTGAAGRADVIEEIARLYSYRRLPRRMPTWPEPGSLNARQQLRRRIRDIVVDLGADEAWTPTLGSDADFDLLYPGAPRVRITNPLASEESVLRATMLTGLVRAWGKNVERATGDVILAEMGTVFVHPDGAVSARVTKGGAGGTVALSLPYENERVTVILGRPDDDATSAVAFWSTVAGRLGLDDVVVRTCDAVPAGWHPTRCARLVDRASGAVLGLVGEVDAALISDVAPGAVGRRLGVLDLDLDVVADEGRATRAAVTVQAPGKYPSAAIDLAFVTPDDVHAQDLARALRGASTLVEDVALFDVFRSSTLPEGTRSLAYGVRLSSPERTLNDVEVAGARDRLIAAALELGARLR
jgi:phenylalanyl-tRNA synthetase beta chain